MILPHPQKVKIALNVLIFSSNSRVCGGCRLLDWQLLCPLSADGTFCVSLECMLSF